MSWLRELDETVESLWDAHLARTPRDDDRSRAIALPFPYVAPTPPGSGIFDGVQYYWDTYFTVIGLVRHERVELARGMVDNLVHLYQRFGMVPAANRYFYTGISQPPLLTAMIAEVSRHDSEPEWADRGYRAAEGEYHDYWMRAASEHDPVHHLIDRVHANRYCDVHLTHATAEDESGWDYTARFEERCLDILPVDLNAFLFRYETDLAQWHRHQGRAEAAAAWATAASRRRRMLDEYMWDPDDGYYHDYDYVRGRRLPIKSLAGFAPLWAGAASPAQAARVIDAGVAALEQTWGLANTEPLPRHQFKQWDHPNGWPNLQWLALSGMRRYGRRADAQRLSQKWLTLTARVHERTGRFWEKYDVVAGDIGKSAGYPTQHGFGWTLGVVAALIHTEE